MGRWLLVDLRRADAPFPAVTGAIGDLRLRMVDLMRTSAGPTIYALSRATGGNQNATTQMMRADSFANAATDCDGVTLLTTRSSEGLEYYAIFDGPVDAVHSASTSLAHALGARLDEVALPNSLLTDTGAIVRLAAKRRLPKSKTTMMGEDVAEIGRQMERDLKPGDWVALTFREPTRVEFERYEDWIQYRLRANYLAHHSMQPASVVSSLWAGSSTRSSAKRLGSKFATSLHGFDVAVRTQPISPMTGALGWLAASVIASALCLLTVLAAPGTTAFSHPVHRSAQALGLVAALTALAGLARLRGLWPTAAHRAWAALAGDAVLPPPAKRHGRSPRPPRDAERDPVTGKRARAFDGDYPLHRSAFKMGPILFVGMVSPSAETSTGVGGARSRAIPPILVPRQGPLLGFNGDTPAHLPIDSLYQGVAILGAAGTGKSGISRTLFGWMCLDASHPSRISGATAHRNTLIAFESKGDGVAAYRAWAQLAGSEPLFVDLADPATLAIDLFATPGNVRERAEAFVNGLAYAFEPGAIQNLAFTSLLAVFTAALAITEEPGLASSVPGIDADGSPVYLANVLLGNLGDALAVALATEVMGRAKNPTASTEALVLAAQALTPHFDGVSPAKRANAFGSSANKVAQLMSLESWWAPSHVRSKESWDSLLAPDATGRHRVVVINTGDTATAAGVAPVEDRLSEIASALLLYTLQRTIRRKCTDWFETGRSVTIVADELSLLAGSNHDVLTWLKDKGRSYGVRCIFATQRPGQLSPQVREALLSFGTLMVFRQESRDVANEAARDLTTTEGDVSGDEIIALPGFHAIIRTHVGQTRTPPCTVAIPHFEGDRLMAAAQQGFDLKAVSAAPHAGTTSLSTQDTPSSAEGPVLPAHLLRKPGVPSGPDLRSTVAATPDQLWPDSFVPEAGDPR